MSDSCTGLLRKSIRACSKGHWMQKRIRPSNGRGIACLSLKKLSCLEDRKAKVQFKPLSRKKIQTKAELGS